MSSALTRVLMIAPYFPPRPRVGAQRPLKFARYLQRHGFAPSVVSLADGAGDDVDVLPAVPQLRLRAPFDRTPGSAVALRRGPRPFSSLRARLDDWIPIDSWWPVLIAQLPRVLAFARAHEPHVIWSTADPWSSHALAARVARALALPWVADFRDPWSLCRVRGQTRPAWVRAIDARAERAYLAQATGVTFTARRTTERYQVAYPAHAARFLTLENSFDPGLYADACDARQPAHAVSDGPHLTLTFLGRFRQLSSAARIVEVLAALRRNHPHAADVRVQSVGELDPVDRARAIALGVADAFETIAPVPLAKSLSLVRAADIALLSTEPGRDEIIPAKLFDYLAAGRPILALADNPDSAAILTESGLGQQFGSEQRDAAARMLAACVEAKRHGAALPLSAGHDPARTLAFSADRTTARLAGVLADAVATRH